MLWTRRVQGLVLTLALLWGGSLWAAAPPPGFADAYLELAALVDSETAGPIEVARGTYLASSFFAVGPVGLPATRTWFRRASTRGQAGVAAMFLASHGTPEDHRDVRHQLESDRAKHGWLFQLVGTKRNVGLAMENGQLWQAVLRALPAAAGCRRFAHLLFDSPDPLVRRGGLYVGYWFATPPYWSTVRDLAHADADPLVRWMAEFLVRTERSTAGPY